MISATSGLKTTITITTSPFDTDNPEQKESPMLLGQNSTRKRRSISNNEQNGAITIKRKPCDSMEVVTQVSHELSEESGKSHQKSQEQLIDNAESHTEEESVCSTPEEGEF